MRKAPNQVWEQNEGILESKLSKNLTSYAPFPESYWKTCSITMRKHGIQGTGNQAWDWGRGKSKENGKMRHQIDKTARQHIQNQPSQTEPKDWWGKLDGDISSSSWRYREKTWLEVQRQSCISKQQETQITYNIVQEMKFYNPCCLSTSKAYIIIKMKTLNIDWKNCQRSTVNKGEEEVCVGEGEQNS